MPAFVLPVSSSSSSVSRSFPNYWIKPASSSGKSDENAFVAIFGVEASWLTSLPAYERVPYFLRNFFFGDKILKNINILGIGALAPRS